MGSLQEPRRESTDPSICELGRLIFAGCSVYYRENHRVCSLVRLITDFRRRSSMRLSPCKYFCACSDQANSSNSWLAYPLWVREYYHRFLYFGGRS